MPADCNDGDVCTIDSCDPVLGCVNTHIPGCVDTDGDGIPDDVFTAMAVRECPPPDLTLSAMATTVMLDLEYVGVAEADEENPGGFLCVNDDDDDNSGVPDKDQAGAIMGENDLHMVNLNVGGLDPSVTVTLSAPTGGSMIKVYEQPDRSMPITLPASWPADMVPSAVYVEGVAPSLAPRDVELKLEATGAAGGTCVDIVKITVVKVDLDVDSNNDGTIDPDNSSTGTEDPIEINSPGKILCVNDDFDEGNIDVMGNPLPDNDDPSPVSADGSALVLDDLAMCFASILPEIDEVLQSSNITITQVGGTGSVRILGIRPNPVAPFNDDWVEVPQGTNLVSDFYLSNGQYNTFDCFLEGLTPGEVDLELNWQKGTVNCTDRVKITVLRLTLSETPASYLPENSNTVQLTATLEPSTLTDTIRFELFDVSDFPGDAMNHGTQADTDPDYKFETTGNPGFTIASNQLTATTNAAVSSATITVTAFDYGAMAKIKATLVNRGCQSQEQTIPLDTDGDSLPDAYENVQPDKNATIADTDGDGTADGEEDDDPQRPVVADAGPDSHANAQTSLGLVGDGLVAFEEYRGFFMMGAHTRTTTGTKDVFVGVDNTGSTSVMPQGVGIGYFANLAGFDVHEIDVNATVPEWNNSGTRLINFRRNGIPSSSDQLAIRVIVNDFLGDLGRAVPSGLALNQSPNEMERVEVDVSLHLPGMSGNSAGPDGMLCTADDVNVSLTAVQADDALRQSVGHECGHAVHLEHTWCFGDLQCIPFGQGSPHATAISTGVDGICNTSATGDDIQIIPIGQGLANAVIITAGPNMVLDSATALSGDDTHVGDTITSGPDGIAQTSAAGDDVQVIPVGMGTQHAICINTGPDGICNTTAGPNDVQVIPVNNGLPDQVCVDDGGDGQLKTSPLGDDNIVGTTITTGANGVCETRAIARITTGPSVMSSDVLVPVPSTYNNGDLDQVRFHLKHP